MFTRAYFVKIRCIAFLAEGGLSYHNLCTHRTYAEMKHMPCRVKSENSFETLSGQASSIEAEEVTIAILNTRRGCA